MHQNAQQPASAAGSLPSVGDGPDHVDVLIIGAGISGIGTACHLQMNCPDRSYAILEGRADFGGTWDLFRYPGIRSDSDMHTLGFSFKPWKAAKAIADGPSIKAYLEETIDEYGLGPHIRYSHWVRSASWSSETGRWTVSAVRRSADGSEQDVEVTCNFLSICSGYYRYDKGHTPEFPGRERFQGTVVHPQHWPEDLDYAGKKVVVIGSGATAMTLIPAMAKDAGHVTMLQRSPTYVVSRPDQDRIANALRKVLPDGMAYSLTRFKNTAFQQWMYRQTRTKPEKVREKLLEMVRKELGDELTEQHFTPRYNPWDQRLCLIPNDDLFEAIKSGQASVVTDEIDTWTESGIQLKSGEQLDADIIVTATGLELLVLGGMRFEVDGQPVDFSQAWTYKGLMYSDVPNLISTFGYINASWTLRADLTAEYLCRLLNHLQETGNDRCTPRLLTDDQGMAERDWIDDFSANYMQRAMHQFPKQGDHSPWLNPQDYGRDKKMFRNEPLEDGRMQFERTAERAGAEPTAARVDVA